MQYESTLRRFVFFFSDAPQARGPGENFRQTFFTRSRLLFPGARSQASGIVDAVIGTSDDAYDPRTLSLFDRAQATLIVPPGVGGDQFVLTTLLCETRCYRRTGTNRAAPRLNRHQLHRNKQ